MPMTIALPFGTAGGPPEPSATRHAHHRSQAEGCQRDDCEREASRHQVSESRSGGGILYPVSRGERLTNADVSGRGG